MGKGKVPSGFWIGFASELADYAKEEQRESRQIELEERAEERADRTRDAEVKASLDRLRESLKLTEPYDKRKQERINTAAEGLYEYKQKTDMDYDEKKRMVAGELSGFFGSRQFQQFYQQGTPQAVQAYELGMRLMQRQDPTPDDFALVSELPSEIGGILGQQMGMLKQHKEKFDLETRKVDESIMFLKSIKVPQAKANIKYTEARTTKVTKEGEAVGEKITDKEKRFDTVGKEITDLEVKRSDHVTKNYKVLRQLMKAEERGSIKSAGTEWLKAYRDKLEAIDSRIQDLRNEKAELGTGEKKEEDPSILEGRIKVLMDKFKLTREQALIMLGVKEEPTE